MATTRQAARFVLRGPAGDVIGFDIWDECRAVFGYQALSGGRIPSGYALHDRETGRTWLDGATYAWEAAT